MPAKNSVKIYVEEGYYHAYNRGLDKRDIFRDEQDYKVFFHFLKLYLSPPPPPDPNAPLRDNPLRGIIPLDKEVELLAYCLMPNHFHLMLVQHSKQGMEKLMRCVLTNYVMYFNKKYQRAGHLFQSSYKAVMLTNNAHFLHLSRYIHLNPKELPNTDPLQWPYSSYLDYLGKRKTLWVHPGPILACFQTLGPISKNFSSYRRFVEDYPEEAKEVLGELVLE